MYKMQQTNIKYCAVPPTAVNQTPVLPGSLLSARSYITNITSRRNPASSWWVANSPVDFDSAVRASKESHTAPRVVEYNQNVRTIELLIR